MEAPSLKPSKGKPTRVLVRNPERVTGKMTELEREIIHVAQENIPQERVAYSVRHYEYEAPFNYPNVNCELGREGTGTGPHPEGMELDIPPFGAVTVEEQEPIIGVTVIGSPCIPPGTVLVFGEPLEWRFARTGVKFKRTGLWGEHICGWGASDCFDEGNRHAGLVSAHFDIPDCLKITVMGYGQLDVHVNPEGKSPDTPLDVHGTWMNDAHFNLRNIRVAVRVME